MRYLATFISVLLVASVVAARPVAAQQRDAVKTMAGILLTVNHFPDDAQKKTLQDLAAQSTTTASEKVLIAALVGLQHSVPAADKPKLQAIAEDERAPESVRSLATILGRFLHMASDEDKATLEKLSM
jgi:hypothetical protein